jgi:hypothetical protein
MRRLEHGCCWIPNPIVVVGFREEHGPIVVIIVIRVG